jgi:hypothetical protein
MGIRGLSSYFAAREEFFSRVALQNTEIIIGKPFLSTTCLFTIRHYCSPVHSVVDPHLFQCGFGSVFFISVRIQIRIRIQGAKPMRIHADLDPDLFQTLKSQKVEFFLGQLFKVGTGNVSKNIKTYEGTKAFLKGRKSCYLLI